jgi:hypothetical protein
MFTLINLCINGLPNEHAPMNAIQAVLSGCNPENGTSSIALQFLHFCVTLLLVFPIAKNTSELMRLDAMVFARSRTKNKLLYAHSITAMKAIGSTVFSVIIAGIATDKLLFLETIPRFLIVVVSIVLNMAIWFLTVHLMLMLHINDGIAFVFMIAISEAFQILTGYAKIFNAFVIFSNSFTNDIGLWISLKAIILCIMYALNQNRITRYEIV